MITPFHERAHMPRIDASPKDRHQPDAARGEVVFLSVLDLRRDWLRTEVLRAALRLCGRARWRLIRTIRDLVSSTSAPAEIVDYEVNCALAMLERCPSGARSSPRRGIESEAHLDHACFRVIARVRHATEIDLTSLDNPSSAASRRRAAPSSPRRTEGDGGAKKLTDIRPGFRRRSSIFLPDERYPPPRPRSWHARLFWGLLEPAAAACTGRRRDGAKSPSDRLPVAWLFGGY